MTDSHVSASSDPFPDAVMDFLVYPTAKFVLRSRFHALVSDELLLVSYDDPETGELRMEPVGYDGSPRSADVVAFTDREWVEGLSDGQSVTLTLRGEDVSATVEPVADSSRVAKYLRAFLKREGVDAAPRVGFEVDGDEVPSREALADAAEGTTALLFELRE